jgi:flagellar hook-associated protein FlgK
VTSSVGDPTLVALADAGLPFPPSGGDLFVSVTEADTGRVVRTKISFDPAEDTLKDIADRLTGIDGIAASVDGQGRIRIDSDPGFRFDFSPRLDPNPDDIAAFGGSRATVSGTETGPFALAAGDALAIEVDGLPAQIVTFDAADFEDISQATAEEIAAVIEAEATGVQASVVDGRLVVQSDSGGSGSSLQMTNATGDPIATLGLSTSIANGSDEPIEITVSGTYTGDVNRAYRFVATGNGEIGVTDGLAVDVYDESGRKVATLDVGDGYVPGTDLLVVDGISVAFSSGAVSADTNDSFTVEALADSDTGGLLASLGLNAFFEGTDAGSIEVAEAIRRDPSLLSGGISGAPGDGRNFLRLLDLDSSDFAALGGNTFEDYYGTLVADIGSGGLRSIQYFESQQALTDFLAQQRDSISGVSLDEEAIQLMQYQRAFEAAAQYIRVVDDTMSEVLSLVS